MKKILILASSFAVLCAALALNAIDPWECRTCWKAGLAATEYGHWCALITLSGFIFFIYKKIHRHAAGIVSLVIIIVSLLSFLRPAIIANQSHESWRTEFEKVFGETGESTPWFQWETLFIGQKNKNEAPVETLTFKTRDGVELRIRYQRAYNFAPAPVIVIVHGGGWDSGDADQLPDLNSVLSSHGYATASVSYRLAPHMRWPTQMNDVEDAMTFLLRDKENLGIDINSIYLLGRSAGAHIAGVLAYARPPSCLKGLIAFYGPTDLTFGWEVAPEEDWFNSRILIEQLMGMKPFENQPLYHTASLTENISPKSVPTLILHGRLDTITWHKHASRLHARLKLAGVPSYVVDLPWAFHGFDFSLRGPGGQISVSSIRDFLSLGRKRECI